MHIVGNLPLSHTLSLLPPQAHCGPIVAYLWTWLESAETLATEGPSLDRQIGQNHPTCTRSVERGLRLQMVVCSVRWDGEIATQKALGLEQKVVFS
jgi:hypothetical protein